MALGAGLAFLMAVSLTGCEMDRMDQEAAETKAEDPADETETAESGDNRTGEIPEETSRGIGAGEAAEPEEASGPDQEPDQPLPAEEPLGWAVCSCGRLGYIEGRPGPV